MGKKFGDYLVVSPGSINTALKRNLDVYTSGRPVKRLGEILLDMGVITQDELETAIRLQRIDRLSRCPLFNTLSNAELAALSNHFTEVSYPPWAKFIQQGQYEPVLYIIAEGRVQVFIMDKSGKEITIAEVGEGEPIGEMGYFSDGVRTASVRTLGPVQLLRAEYNNLTTYFERAEGVGLAFMQVVNQRRKELEQIKQQEHIGVYDGHPWD